MATSLKTPAFTQAVANAVRSLYPEVLADRAWDNVGLLQDNIDYADDPSLAIVKPPSHNVLLTNDLTIWVAEEAIRKKCSVIVSYHPFIFRGMKSVSLNDPHQRIVLLLAQNNIAVYSPHTAIDAAPGGMNDWLADMLDGHGVTTKRSVVQPIAAPLPTGFGGAGYGRLVEFSHPVNLGRIVEAYAEGLGGLRHIMVARPKKHAEPIMIKSVGICPGSGNEVLKDCPADLLVTGEMSHHYALRFIMLGKCIITVFHSNSERRFLKKRLQRQLHDLLRKDWLDAEVLLSDQDEDPFEIWDVSNMPAWAYESKK
ncbi:NGG1p interacting factor 3 [Thozetella sp. PMI_491]|nr:NGG1p interacting factor 3 [Thozetella sp. PMI_491]